LNQLKKENLKDTLFLNLDISKKESIDKSLKEALVVMNKEKFDILIEDTTHIFKDQIRFIYQSLKYLKAGGILVIEDIYYNVYDESLYLKALKNIMHKLKQIKFVTIKHAKQNDYGLNNSKLLVIVKR
jgi:hypothetical protein